MFTIGAIALFVSGVIVYGIILNLRAFTLSEAMSQKGFTELENTNILIDRKTYTLSLYEDTVFVKSYRVSFGRNLNDKKKLQDDGATPVGIYKVCDIQKEYKYYKFIKINYPI